MLLHYLPDGAGEAVAAVVTATLLIGPLLFSLVELAGRRRRPWSLLAEERNDAEPEIEHRSDLMAPAVVDADALVMCAVCETPSITRCSRCKAVRYCSRKCQIIDWRSGHKVVCRAPRVDHHSLDHEEAKPFDGSAFTSKAERLHKILEEMEATLSSRRALHSIHSSPVASRPGPSKDAVDAASDLRLVEGSQSEELQALRVKLEQVTAERDALSSKVELLRSEIKVLKRELNARPRIKMFEGFLL